MADKKGSSTGSVGAKRGAQGSATMDLAKAKSFAKTGSSKPNLNAMPKSKKSK